MRMNRVILLLAFSDIAIVTGFGLVDPILAIFIQEDIVGGSVFAAGLASSIFLVAKSLTQLPFSLTVDKTTDAGKKRWLIFGTACVTAVPFLYIAANHITMIYIAQILHGIGSGIAYAAWLGLWSTHLDEGRESFEWSLYSTLTGLGSAASALIGATVAEVYGFPAVIISAGIFSVAGCILLFLLTPSIGKRVVEDAEVLRQPPMTHV